MSQDNHLYCAGVIWLIDIAQFAHISSIIRIVKELGCTIHSDPTFQKTSKYFMVKFVVTAPSTAILNEFIRRAEKKTKLKGWDLENCQQARPAGTGFENMDALATNSLLDTWAWLGRKNSELREQEEK